MKYKYNRQDVLKWKIKSPIYVNKCVKHIKTVNKPCIIIIMIMITNNHNHNNKYAKQYE